MVRKLMNVVFVLVLVLVFVMPVAADGREDAGVVDQKIEMMADNLFSLLYNATYLPFAAGLVTILVSLSKRVSYLSGVSSPALVMFWTVMVWALWVGAVERGYGAQFETMVQSITTIASTLLGVSVTPLVAGRLYEVARTQGVALVGYQRGYAEEYPGVG